MTASVLPDLDAETVEELRPPCDSIDNSWFKSRKCERPAQWICRVHCHDCNVIIDGLLCEEHKTYFVDVHGRGRCPACDRRPMRYTCLSAERL